MKPFLKGLLSVNTPLAATGYGVQAKWLLPRWKKIGFHCDVLAYYGVEGGIHEWNGHKLYPRGYDPYGQDVAESHRLHAGADILMTLMDIWVLDTAHMGERWAPYFPVDHEPIPYEVCAKASQSFYPIVYSRFAERMCQDAGLHVAYAPHCVPCDLYAPADQGAARAAIGMPQDRFVVGLIAMNKGWPSRKCLSQQIAGFARFADDHPDAILYLHTQTGQHGELGGINLAQEIADVGLVVGENVFFCQQYPNLLGFPDEYMVNAYNSMDVLLSATIGEGFGVPVLEAQSCGTPVIVGDWTATSELCFAGWKIDKDEAFEWRNAPQRSYQWIPQPDAIADRLNQSYQFLRGRDATERARDGALAYDADRVVADYWMPILHDIARALGKPVPRRKAPATLELRERVEVAV